MLERDAYPAGVLCWVDTTQPDSEAATAFYRDPLTALSGRTVIATAPA